MLRGDERFFLILGESGPLCSVLRLTATVTTVANNLFPLARVEISGGGIVERGGKVHLTCNATGEPFPPAYIEWYKNGQKVMFHIM